MYFDFFASGPVFLFNLRETPQELCRDYATPSLKTSFSTVERLGSIGNTVTYILYTLYIPRVGLLHCQYFEKKY